MIIKDKILEFYFRFLTILFWSFIIYNWIFIPNESINHHIFVLYLNLSLIYLFAFTVNEIKLHNLNKDDIHFFYRFISVVTFTTSILYLLLFPNNIKLLLFKSFLIFLYFYISYKKVFKFKKEEGLVGIIGSVLIFTLGIYY